MPLRIRGHITYPKIEKPLPKPKGSTCNKLSRVWTPADDSKLAELYSKMSCARIAVVLDRKEGAVYHRASMLMLRKKTKRASEPSNGHAIEASI